MEKRFSGIRIFENKGAGTMKKRFSGITILIITILLAMPAAITAADSESSNSPLKGFSVGAGVGLLGGLNVNVGYRIPSDNWKHRFGFRGDFNTLLPFDGLINDNVDTAVNNWLDDNGRSEGRSINFRGKATADDVEFTTSRKGSTIGALVDFYPLSQFGLRVSGGYYFGKQEFDADVNLIKIQRSLETIKWEAPIQTTYGEFRPEISGTLTAQIPKVWVKANGVANSAGPYAGIGWDVRLSSRLNLTLDAGMVFTKSHNASVTYNLRDDFNTLGLKLIDESTSVGEIKDIIIDIENDSSIITKDPSIITTAELKSTVSRRLKEELSLRGYKQGDYYDIGQYNVGVKFNRVLEIEGVNIDTSINNNANNAATSALQGARDELNDFCDEIDTSTRNVNNRAKDYPYFPVFKIGIQWRF